MTGHMQINEYQKLAMQTLNPELEKKEVLIIVSWGYVENRERLLTLLKSG